MTTARALRGPFDYRLPDELREAGVQVGSMLVVPFGRRNVLGVVVGLADSSEVREEKLLAPLRALELGVPPAMVGLAQWIAAEYCSTLARALSRAQLIDEYVMILHPIIAGPGGDPTVDAMTGGFQSQHLALMRISNLITTRSDSFTVYVLVQGWRDAGTPAPRLVVQRRAAIIVDRSAMTPTNRKPGLF